MSVVPTTAKMPRKKVAGFETKKVTCTRFICIPHDEKKDVFLAKDLFLVTGEQEHNSRTFERIRDILGGPPEKLHVIHRIASKKSSDAVIWADGNGKPNKSAMNERATELRYQWLAKHRPDMSIEQCEYHCLIVGDVLVEVPRKCTIVINRELPTWEFKARITAMEFIDGVEIWGNRVFCMDETDAFAVALAIRGKGA